MKRRKQTQPGQPKRRYGNTTEHQFQHQLRKERGFEPGRRATKSNDPKRSSFINQLLARKRAEALEAKQAAAKQEPGV